MWKQTWLLSWLRPICLNSQLSPIVWYWPKSIFLVKRSETSCHRLFMVFPNVLWSSFTTVSSTRVLLCCKQCSWQVDVCQGCVILSWQTWNRLLFINTLKRILKSLLKCWYWYWRQDQFIVFFSTGIALKISWTTYPAFRNRTSIKVKETTLKINLTLKDLPGAYRYVFNSIITVAFSCEVDILHVCTAMYFRYVG